MREGAGGVTIGVDLSYLKTVLKWARAVKRIAAPVSAVDEARELLRHMQVETRGQERDRRPTKAEIESLCQHWRNNPRQTIPMATR